ncbi:hypothetical protein NDN08_007457 [Rhodosorus marinus]|uniref:Uncharacterized protein n=1 Tax=Rhodosorus marinus TaxID=101924 RepID=A0AAV8V1P8_9RHOD|nr:hypothetical protein NDN08_007457 [Rhodosorus marinus]
MLCLRGSSQGVRELNGWEIPSVRRAAYAAKVSLSPNVEAFSFKVFAVAEAASLSHVEGIHGSRLRRAVLDSTQKTFALNEASPRPTGLRPEAYPVEKFKCSHDQVVAGEASLSWNSWLECGS